MDVRADRELQQLFSAKKPVGLDTPLQWRKAGYVTSLSVNT
jgi:hypothetical protein